MTDPIYYPPKLMRESSNDWNIVGNVANAGQSTVASVDVRSDGGGFWSASLNTIQFWDETDTRCWRALRQVCGGGIVPIAVPRNDLICAPYPVGAVRSSIFVSFSDASFFDDGSLFTQTVIDVVNSGGAALRATSMTLLLNYCGPLQGGESFSIFHPTFGWRLYEISTVSIVDATHTLINFNPPLREAVSNGDRIEFERLYCTMKLASPGAMDLNFTTWPFSAPSVKFVESKYA